MSRVRGRETKDEIRLAKALWHKGYRYRKNNRKIKGTPDISFFKHKLAIFVDGEFWHGHNWESRRGKIKSNSEFWEKKIQRNIQRDQEVNEHLKNQGWIVLRFWSNEIKRDLDKVIKKIEEHLPQPENAIRLTWYPEQREEIVTLAAEPNQYHTSKDSYSFSWQYPSNHSVRNPKSPNTSSHSISQSSMKNPPDHKHIQPPTKNSHLSRCSIKFLAKISCKGFQ